MKRIIPSPFILALLLLALTACRPPAITVVVETPLPAAATIRVSASNTPTVAPTATATQAPTTTATETRLPTSSPTTTPTPFPTYAVLRGKVIIDQAVCHYGPGAPYLYKYGVYKDSDLEILRRIEYGNYVEVQAIGGDNRCWVRDDYFELKGEFLDLEPVSAADVPLPITPYYASPGGVSARRSGNEVSISWNPLIVKLGDDSEQVPYIIEAWCARMANTGLNRPAHGPHRSPLWMSRAVTCHLAATSPRLRNTATRRASRSIGLPLKNNPFSWRADLQDEEMFVELSRSARRTIS
jgi:hypothetical protein